MQAAAAAAEAVRAAASLAEDHAQAAEAAARLALELDETIETAKNRKINSVKRKHGMEKIIMEYNQPIRKIKKEEDQIILSTVNVLCEKGNHSSPCFCGMNMDDLNSQREYQSVTRLPFRKTEPESWVHDPKGESYGIKFSVNKNIKFHGVGLLVCEDIERVGVRLFPFYGKKIRTLRTDDGQYHNVKKSDRTVPLKFKNPISLDSDRVYLIGLGLVGGASIVGHGGKEVVTGGRQEVVTGGRQGNVVFKFENWEYDFQNKTTINRTTVEKGLINQIFFEL